MFGFGKKVLIKKETGTVMVEGIFVPADQKYATVVEGNKEQQAAGLVAGKRIMYEGDEKEVVVDGQKLALIHEDRVLILF